MKKQQRLQQSTEMSDEAKAGFYNVSNYDAKAGEKDEDPVQNIQQQERMQELIQLTCVVQTMMMKNGIHLWIS